MPRFELLVGSAAFWNRAKRDIAAARRRVLVQAMTFEGDAAGLGVARVIAAATAPDRRVLVDDYSRHVINDTMLALSRDRAVHAEARATLAMFDRLVAQDVAVRITNPVLGHPLRYPLRNHKKLLVMDDVAWIGGINFSDHNFAWHDLMLRIDDAAVTEFLVADWERDWAGCPRGSAGSFPGLDLVCLDGETNAALFAPLLDLVAGARRSVEMISAYPTMPFVEAMAQAARGGARVDLFTPAANNKPVIRDYLCGVAGKAGIALHLTPGMTHAKALLIDGETLLLGSSNFNFASYRTSSDIVAVCREAALVADFRARVLDPLRAGAAAGEPAGRLRWRGLRAKLGLQLADAAITRLRHGPRVMEWPS